VARDAGYKDERTWSYEEPPVVMESSVTTAT